MHLCIANPRLRVANGDFRRLRFAKGLLHLALCAQCASSWMVQGHSLSPGCHNDRCCRSQDALLAGSDGCSADGSCAAGGGAVSGDGRLQPFTCSLGRLPTGASAVGSGAAAGGAGSHAGGGAGGGAVRDAAGGAVSGGGRLQPFPCSLGRLPTGAAAAGSGAAGRGAGGGAGRGAGSGAPHGAGGSAVSGGGGSSPSPAASDGCPLGLLLLAIVLLAAVQPDDGASLLLPAGVLFLPLLAGGASFPLLSGGASFPLLAGGVSFSLLAGRASFPLLAGVTFLPLLGGAGTLAVLTGASLEPLTPAVAAETTVSVDWVAEVLGWVLATLARIEGRGEGVGNRSMVVRKSFLGTLGGKRVKVWEWRKREWL
ncbi:hypothetical protein NDU88_001421 [Pleurodeles waltl]|uniref:Uncharacterized protein n=1 Tax=Pleurodeles waltl TaxID=8319 RepID=A0AAV7LFV8_PLEWA|nr:hypothetical protein NDU88_001421 [Pleurodeles waltl]